MPANYLPLLSLPPVRIVTGRVWGVGLQVGVAGSAHLIKLTKKELLIINSNNKILFIISITSKNQNQF